MKETFVCLFLGLLLYHSSAQLASLDPYLSIAAGNTQFALELLQTTSLEVGKYMNIALSPFGVWTVLTLVKEGSGGKTSYQLQKALHLGDNVKLLRGAYRNLNNALHVVSNGVEMVGTNAIFTDTSRPLNWEFQYLAANVYDSDVIPVNFGNPGESVNIVNKWVANVTHNRITQLVHEEDLKDPHLVIASGNFFKGKWMFPFSSSRTRVEKFYDNNGVVLGEVEMMFQSSHFRYSRIDDLRAHVVELPYQDGKYSMMVMVPRGNATVDKVLEHLSQTPFEKIYHVMAAEEKEYPGGVVDVYLPKVVINSDFVLNRALEKLGIIDVFNDAKADLSGMSTHNLHLDKLIHKAEIVIDEEGTTASSATGGMMADRQQSPKVRANRPFLFFIVENTTKIVIYAGKVVNPHM